MVERVGTICVQGGWRPGDGEPRQVPIYQNTTWKYDTSEHMGRLFDLDESGYFYTRLANPTNDAVAEHLASHPKVAWVRHPSLEGDSEAALAAKYLPEGSCGVVSFGVAGGRAAAETFMKNLRLAQIATHVADARTCVLHPANATHRQMNDAELEAAGISADLVRLSCGIEDAADLIADIDQALAAVE